MVLTARSKEDLKVAKAEIEAVAKGVKVHIVPCDLGDLQRLPALCKEMLAFADPSVHSQYVLVHNAGSMNTFDKPFEAFNDPKEIHDYFALNYTSMAVLTAHFLSTATSGHRWIVNISSKLATFFIPGFPLYSPARAAREAYMGVVTAEKPDVRTLNYCPGVCATAMFESIPKEISRSFPPTITCQESIGKFVSILKENAFESGCTIDYYD